MALAGLLAAVSPVLGQLGQMGGTPPDSSTSSAAANVTTSTSLTSGSMAQGGASPLFLLVFGLVLYWAFER